MKDAATIKELIARARIAYFSMEVGFESSIRTYSGGLGGLAGDTLKAAADLRVPMVGVTIAYREGYLKQTIDSRGRQTEQADTWSLPDKLVDLDCAGSLILAEKTVGFRAWGYQLRGTKDPQGRSHDVPIVLLDTQIESNDADTRSLSDSLYGGDSRMRLRQEALLGLGGLEALTQLGATGLQTYHLNEGHSALLGPGLFLRQIKGGVSDAASTQQARETVRTRCAFTTHTPVPAGHDRFPRALVEEQLEPAVARALEQLDLLKGDELNMTHLAIAFSGYINGVSLKHGEVSRAMFPGSTVDAVTNGVHAATWVGDGMASLFDQELAGWRNDNSRLHDACTIDLEAIAAAHRRNKEKLMAIIAERSGAPFSAQAFTLGFARRSTAYKRADMLLEKPQELEAIAAASGPLQIVYAGKAHPRDAGGKDLIEKIVGIGSRLGPEVKLVFLENYDMDLARDICAGVDLWLNTPQRPKEASGTSGMKAAMNGVPSLSTLDGWWIEGCIEGVTGWAIGNGSEQATRDQEVASLYAKLHQIAELYADNATAYQRIRRHAICLNGSYFTAQRMVDQYRRRAYRYQAE